MALTEKEREILTGCAAGKSLCFSQDGENAWLSRMPVFPPSYDAACRSLIEQKFIACDPDAGHWTEANCFDITDAGRAALAPDNPRGDA